MTKIVFPENSQDAFGRLRTSTPFTVFESMFMYDLHPLLFESILTGTGAITHAATTTSANLAVGAGAGSSIYQSRRWFRYIPGKSHSIAMTFVMGTHVAGTTYRAGFYETNNGIYVERDSTGQVWLVRRSNVSGSVVNERVQQDAWNVNTLRGNRNYDDLDMSKGQIFAIDLQWLSLGRVRCGFYIGGHFILCHEFKHAGILDVPYMRTATLPVRWEISGTTSATFKAIACTVQSEGGDDHMQGYLFQDLSGVIQAASGTPTFMRAYRLKTTFNSIAVRYPIDITNLVGAVTGANDVLYDIYYNPTVTGGVWTDYNATYSAMQVNAGGALSSGIKVASFVIPATQTSKQNFAHRLTALFPFVLDASGAVYTTMGINATGIGGVSNNYVGLGWEEVR
jgi:hypothetical protein